MIGWQAGLLIVGSSHVCTQRSLVPLMSPKKNPPVSCRGWDGAVVCTVGLSVVQDLRQEKTVHYFLALWPHPQTSVPKSSASQAQFRLRINNKFLASCGGEGGASPSFTRLGRGPRFWILTSSPVFSSEPHSHLCHPRCLHVLDILRVIWPDTHWGLPYVDAWVLVPSAHLSQL